MDPNTASQFVSSLVQCIQAFCHGYVQFSSSIEIVGHIYLNVDNSSKFNYIVNEEVNKIPGNLTTVFHTNSYHSLPPTKQMLLKAIRHGDPNMNMVSGSPAMHNSASSSDLISTTLPVSSTTTSVAYPVSIIQNDMDWTMRAAVHSHPRSIKDSTHKSSPELLSSKHFWKRKKYSKHHHHTEHISPALDPAVLIKQEPEICFPHNSYGVKNMASGKKHAIEEDTLIVDEPGGAKVNSKVNDEPHSGTVRAKLESPDMENCSNLTAGSESVISDTSSTHPTKCLSSQIRHQIVEYANIVGNRPAARHFGVHESSIRHWRKKFGMVLQGVGRKRGRKRKDDSFQDMRNLVVNATTVKVEDTEQP